MKIVVVDNPKFIGFFLRKFFRIKKLPGNKTALAAES